MASLGLQAYRFSIAWARASARTGPVNPAGLDFYDRLVDALLEKGIEPLATLYHWDLPAALDDRGGWLNRDIAGWFADYAEIMFARLDGRVKKWATLNEPWVVTDGGYLHGALAPGHRNLFEAPIASRNLMRAHGAAVQRYRSVGANQIGLVVNLEPKYPLGRRGRSCRRPPLARLHEPAISRSGLRPRLPGGARRDIRPRLDRLERRGSGAGRSADRLARRQLLYARRDEARPGLLPVQAAYVRQPGKTYSETGWEVFEQGLTDVLLWVKERYGNRRSTSPKTVPPSSRADGAGQARARPAARRLPPAASARRSRRRRGRRRRPRLHGLVADGQSRMVARFFEAVRHRPCRFRHPAAHAQGQRALLFADRRHQRRRAGGRSLGSLP